MGSTVKTFPSSVNLEIPSGREEKRPLGGLYNLPLVYGGEVSDEGNSCPWQSAWQQAAGSVQKEKLENGRSFTYRVAQSSRQVARL